jgi:hypothetical protein
MALELVSVEEAVLQIRGDADIDGPWLQVFIPAISEAVRSWLKDDWRLYTPERDSNGDIVLDSSGDAVPLEDSVGPVIHPTVRAAVLIEIASQYRFREGEGDNAVESHQGHGYVLSKAATALLSGLRRTTVA